MNPRAEEAFDSLLLARLFMFSAVYYHRTTRATVKIIEQFLKEASSKLCFRHYIENIDEYSKLDEQSLMFHPLLKDSQNRIRLLNRDIPYSRVKEIPLRYPNPLIEEDILTSGTRSRLPNRVREKLTEESFFIDTPKIASNPLIGEERFIYLDNPDNPNEPISRDITQISFGALSQEIAIVRLYIHDDYRNYEVEIINAFPSEARRPQTYY